jgi:hypothetical protein
MVIWATNWDGFVPPEFEARHAAELRIAGPVQALALAGLYAMFFAFPASELRKAFDTTTWRRIISISVVVALALWLVGPAARLPKARGEFDLVPVGLALIYATLTTLHNTEILGSVNG